ncbi:MAG: Rpp14/Pop5 family protein [Promethearchaeota archaeon]
MKRGRRRYLSFRLHSEEPLCDGEKQLSNAIWKNLLSLYGETNAADSKLYLVSFDCEKGMGILQCMAAHLERVITSAVLIGAIGKSMVSFEPIQTSGTIKGLSR